MFSIPEEPLIELKFRHGQNVFDNLQDSIRHIKKPQPGAEKKDGKSESGNFRNHCDPLNDCNDYQNNFTERMLLGRHAKQGLVL